MIYILLALLLYTAVTIFATAASRRANPLIVAAIEAAVSAIIPLLVVLPLIGKRTGENSRLGIIFAVLSGVAIGLFTIAAVKSFAVNKVGIVAPIVFGGSIFSSTLLSYFIFKEELTLIECLGLGTMGIGLIVLIYARATVKS